MATRVNSTSIGASSTGATAYTVTLPVGAAAGDIIRVTAESNGTHVSNGMTVQDSVNLTAFTVLTEVDCTNASSRWCQWFEFQTPVALPSGTTITFTPYAASTLNGFVVDILRGDTLTEPVVRTTVNSPLGTSYAAPAFASAPPAGSAVWAGFGTAATTASVSAAYTLCSQVTTNVNVSNAFVLSADGSSTYAATWTIGASNSSAGMDAAFSPGVAAATPVTARGALWAA